MRATEKMEDGLERRTSMVKVSPETSAAYTKYRTKLSPQTSDDVKRVAVVTSGSRRTGKPARSSARTPRCSQPTFGAYEGETTPMMSPLAMAGGRSSGGRAGFIGAML